MKYIQKCKDSRQNFRCRYLVQFKVRIKIWLFKMSKVITVFKDNTFQKPGYRGSRQKQLNFRCRSLEQLMVRMNIWLFRMSKAITIWILNSNLNTFQLTTFLTFNINKKNKKPKSICPDLLFQNVLFVTQLGLNRTEHMSI